MEQQKDSGPQRRTCVCVKAEETKFPFYSSQTAKEREIENKGKKKKKKKQSRCRTTLKS